MPGRERAVNPSSTTPGAVYRQRPTRTLVPDLADFFGGNSVFSGLRPFFEKNLLRVEDTIGDGRYEVRGEIPGVDPAKDVDITVADGILNIKAVRSHKAESQGRSVDLAVQDVCPS